VQIHAILKKHFCLHWLSLVRPFFLTDPPFPFLHPFRVRTQSPPSFRPTHTANDRFTHPFVEGAEDVTAYDHSEEIIVFGARTRTSTFWSAIRAGRLWADPSFC
jgi:hypothetical protein